MSTLLYFTYGSNMSTHRLTARTPSARVVAPARLERHRLKFHKRDRRGSAKCDIEHTGDPADSVYGVVFEILTAEKPILDAKEGLGVGYDIKHVSVTAGDGNLIYALTYYAIDIDASLKPFHWYKEHVVRGAREHNLPPEYISVIEAVESIDDPDLARHEDELSIYRMLK